MKPTLRHNDWVIYQDRWVESALLNQVVVCEHPYESSLLIKRVSRLSGDAVYLSGDCARASTDSRSFGLVPIRKVRGIVRSYHSRSSS